SDDDQRALARQGFVAAEFRGRGGRRQGPYFKLRWRQDGRQRVRYLGREGGRAEQVRAALADLQRPLRLAREIAGLMAEARGRLRHVKQLVEPGLASRGRYFHGYTARREGQPAANQQSASPAQESKSIPWKGLDFKEEQADVRDESAHERGGGRCFQGLCLARTVGARRAAGTDPEGSSGGPDKARPTGAGPRRP